MPPPISSSLLFLPPSAPPFHPAPIPPHSDHAEEQYGCRHYCVHSSSSAPQTQQAHRVRQARPDTLGRRPGHTKQTRHTGAHFGHRANKAQQAHQEFPKHTWHTKHTDTPSTTGHQTHHAHQAHRGHTRQRKRALRMGRRLQVHFKTMTIFTPKIACKTRPASNPTNARPVRKPREYVRVCVRVRVLACLVSWRSATGVPRVRRERAHVFASEVRVKAPILQTETGTSNPRTNTTAMATLC